MQDSDIKRDFRYLLQLRYGIIGDSPEIQKAIETLEMVAPTDLTVLITGETGTGKEVFANAIHSLSNRRKFPFISVNCGAIPETLLESELFGSEKGAYTGAVETRKGFFETADKGTIFLDEIGEMPIGTQVKLLRVLETGQFSRLGSPEIRKVDVRVIAATNRNLEDEVAKGNFRQDLFFRLNAVQIELPPLREHVQDIPLLVEYFAERVAEKYKFKFEGISYEAITILKSLPWPGNIRQLKNLIETIVTLEKGAFISREILLKYIPPALPEHKRSEIPKTNSIVAVTKELPDNETSILLKSILEIKSDIADIKHFLGRIASNFDLLFEDIHSLKQSINGQNENPQTEIPIKPLELVEKEMIIAALSKFSNNRRMAARALGISERTLYRKLIEYGIK
ncbi:MAG TPA: sigma-54 dependent transcriptional regulator [Candidatus Kapabacteria bacterium]|nr:sigma-54 dependent transcriptional regulator [Candidatus Kapabacteria bacterium]